MTFTYDPTTPRGLVRLYIPDSIEATRTFEDEEIDAFLATNGHDVFLAAAAAVETIATSEALVLKVMSSLGSSTDGAKLCSALLERADRLRANAGSNAEGEYVGVASAIVDEWTAREMAA